mgnify:FL=1
MGIFNKFIKFLGFEVEENEKPKKKEKKLNTSNAEYNLKKENNVTDEIPLSQQNTVTDNKQELVSAKIEQEIFVAENQNDIQKGVAKLKQCGILQVDLSKISETDYTRIMDFLFGVIFALDGEIIKIDQFNYILKTGEYDKQ